MLFGKKSQNRARESQISSAQIFSLALAINTELEKLHGTNPKFSGAYAASAGRHISVRYHSTQEPYLLDYQSACRYLNWIKAGHCGRHTEISTQ